MLITCVLHIRPEGHLGPRNEVGSLSPAEHLVGFEPTTFRFWLQRLNPLCHSANNNNHQFKVIVADTAILSLLSYTKNSFSLKKKEQFSLNQYYVINDIGKLPRSCTTLHLKKCLWHMYYQSRSILIFVGNNGECQYGYFKTTKHAQFSEKTNISYPLIRTRASPYQGVKNVHFVGKFGVSCFGVHHCEACQNVLRRPQSAL